METHHIRLTSSEVGGLWANYIADSMFVCVYKYYLAKVEDAEIKKVLEHALDLSQQHVQVVTKIFKEEGHAIPLGFIENDVNVDAPRLFSDEFFLFFTKHMTKGALVTYGTICRMLFATIFENTLCLVSLLQWNCLMIQRTYSFQRD